MSQWYPMALTVIVGTVGFSGCGGNPEEESPVPETASPSATATAEPGTPTATAEPIIPTATAEPITPTSTPEAVTPTATLVPTPQPDPLSLTLLHINDHHSHLESEELSVDVSQLSLQATADGAGSPVSTVQLQYGGLPLLTSLFASLESASDALLKLHAGDATTGTLYYTLFEGEADAELMNLICFDAFVVGNHEFDNGDDGLATFLDALAEGSCQTPVLGANVVPGPSSPLADGYLEPFSVQEVAGQSVGIIGIATAYKTKSSSSPDPETTFLDELVTAQQYIDQLESEGINKIILLSHFGYENDLALAESLSGVDVIVDGDSHSLLGGESLSSLGWTVVGDYPTRVKDSLGGDVCVVQAWEYAHLLGRLDVSFDGQGRVVSCAGTPLVPFDQGALTYEYTDASGVKSQQLLGEADTATVLGSLAAVPELVPVSPNTTSVDALAEYSAQVEVLSLTVIGTVAEDLCLERFPGQGRSTLCPVADTYEHGSVVGDVVAQAYLEVSPTADICIQNAGGVRVDIAAGDFTIEDAYTVLPFSNTLVTLELTGQQIVDVLEDALSNHLDDGGSSGSYPYASGVRYRVNASAAAGSRVTQVEINVRMAGNFVPIELDTVYTVVTNSFIASGQDGYDTFGEVYDAGLYTDLYTEYAQGLVDYIESLTSQGLMLEARPVENASTQVYIGRDGCNHSEQTTCTSY